MSRYTLTLVDVRRVQRYRFNLEPGRLQMRVGDHMRTTFWLKGEFNASLVDF
jgi:hypothetical protein